MEFEQIVQLIREVSNSRLTQFRLQEEGFCLSMKAEKETKQVLVTGETKEAVPEVILAEEKKNMEKGPGIKAGESVVISPLVGTFYRSSSPDAEPYVKVGEHVKKGQVLAIVEAMKLMNEIESEFDGTVKEILSENESMVEYGQTLFIIEEDRK